MVRAAAIQVEVVLGDVGRNLVESERLVREAASEGATLIALPEFFPTGAAFDERVARAAMAEDGEASQLLCGLAGELGVHLGGSFLCRDPDGHVRNAYLLAGPDGRVLGRHDKDLPTMWENALYVGGYDDGVIDAGPFTAGAAVCWEFMRAPTARRLRGRVDVVVGGSNWWSVPPWPPRRLSSRFESANAATARRAPAVFGRLVGAPVVHGAIAGRFTCPTPWMPGLPYRGHFQGGALVAAADGTVLASRGTHDGPGFAVADVAIGRTEPLDPVPDRYWLHRRIVPSAVAWHVQRAHGRRWYARNVSQADDASHGRPWRMMVVSRPQGARDGRAQERSGRGGRSAPS